MPWTTNFVIDHHTRTIQVLDSSNGKDTSAACIAAFQSVIDAAIDQNIFSILNRMHSEHFKIMGSNYFASLERFAAPLFGIASRGAHLTAYVRASEGLKVWVARRAPHLFIHPNKLDTSVAGGVKAAHTPLQCMIEEADEEASLPADFVRENIKATGVVSYVSQSPKTGLLHSNVLYVYDIELPATMIPVPKDDEVAEFQLLTVEEIRHAMVEEQFKPNCVSVMLDFFVRHGILTEENEKDYVEIVTRLRRKLPVPTTSDA